jgi:PAS domain S-box-containing protein
LQTLAKEPEMKRKAIPAAAKDLGAKRFINRFSIGRRLVLCFVGIFVLLLAVNGTLLWQFHSAQVGADRRLTGVSLELIAALNLQSSLQSFNDRLDRVAQSQDPVLLRQESGSLRDMILDSVQDARNAITHLPAEVRLYPTFVPTIEVIESTLPSQLESLNSLSASGDWSALRLRLANEKQPLDAETSMLVKSITRELNDELGQTVTNIAHLERQMVIVLPLTGLGTLLVASLLGVMITRSITTPLGKLMESSSALSRGEFDHLVRISGDDELARLGRVFNDTADKLRSLYETLQDSKAKLEEAQRIAHVGYWEWDLTSERVTWSDETYRIYGLQPQERPIDIAVIRKMIHPEDLEVVFRVAEEAVRGGLRTDVEHRIIRTSGEVRTVHSQGDLKKDASGRPCQMFGTVQDITDRKRAEEALKQSQFYLAEGQRLANMGSWAFNPSGFFDYWSQELFEIYGLDPQKGAPTLEQYLATIHPQDRDFMANTIKRMHAERSGCDVKKRVVRPGGELRYIRCVGIPVVEGEVLKGFLGTAVDITEQELLTQELRRERAYLTDSQSMAHIGGWAYNLVTHKLLHSSDANARLYGFDPSQGPIPTERYFDTILAEDEPRVTATLDNAARTGMDFYLPEYRIRHTDGSIRFLRAIGHKNSSGEPGEYVGVTMDITELKSAEQEREKLRQLEAELAHIDRVSTLGEMAASLAHEIKQPIAAAITSANSCIEWLAHEPPNLDRARAAAARIDKYGNRAAEIIDRIRSFYKKSPPQRELVDVNGIIHELFTLLKGEADRFSVAMRTELADELPKIMVDRVQLQQVFMNLMLNAIEAMKDSGGELTVNSELQDGQLQFSVSDTGVGLPMEKMDQIFSAFFTTKPQGSGMGLAISRSIVESHGGQLWASANGGGGATFHFTLPIQVAESSPLVA